MSKINLIRTKVEEILRNNQRSRDNDMILATLIWEQEIEYRIVDLNSVSRHKVFSMLINRELTSYESITRCRRKIQQHNPDLRGFAVQMRAMEAEEVKQEVRNFRP